MRPLATLPPARRCAASLPRRRLAQDYPKLKPGQWEMTTTSSKAARRRRNKMTMCTRRRRPEADDGHGQGHEQGDVLEARHAPRRRKYIGDSVCKIGDSTMTSHSVMTIQGDTAYKTVVTATYDPPLMGMKDTNTTIEGKNVGPCRDGLQPGDVVIGRTARNST